MFNEVADGFLVKNGFLEIFLTSKNKDGYTPIGLAAVNKEWDLVKYLAKQIQLVDNLNDKAQAGRALVLATCDKQFEVVKELLHSKTIDLYWETTGENIGYTCLHHAIANNTLDIAEQLLIHGFDPNNQAGNKLPLTPMQIALNSKNWAAIKLLAQYNADLRLKGKYNNTPISLAAENNEWDLVHYLTKKAQLIESFSDDTQAGAALFYAIFNKSDALEDKKIVDIVNELLEIKSINLNWTFGSGEQIGYKCLHHAIVDNKLEIAKALLIHKCNPDEHAENKNQTTPMQIALDAKNWAAIKLLAEYNADLTIKNKNGYTPIRLAAKNKEWDLVHYLAQRILLVANLDDRADAGNALLDAVVNNQSEVVNELLKIKSIKLYWATNTEGSVGYTCLHHAIANNQLDIAEQLLIRGFEPNTLSVVKGCPLPMRIALDSKNWGAIKLLAKYKADLTIKGKNDHTPIGLAALNNNWELVKYLALQIQSFNSLNDKEYAGMALLSAAKSNKSEVVYELLKIEGIKLYWEDGMGEHIGYMCLHYALANKNIDMAKQLLIKGFDPNKHVKVDNKFCLSPIEIALETKNWNAVQLLTTHNLDFSSLLKNQKFQLESFIEDVISGAIFDLTKTKQRNFKLATTDKMELQKSLITSFLRNELFTNTFLFQEGKVEKNKKSFTIKNLAYCIANAILQPQPTTYLNFFRNRICQVIRFGSINGRVFKASNSIQLSCFQKV